MNDRIRVQIYGREYEMDPGGLTHLEVQSLANFVDERMREVADKSAVVDTQKIAVLAAINIALDYLQGNKQGGVAPSEDVSSKLQDLTKILDKALAV